MCFFQKWDDYFPDRVELSENDLKSIHFKDPFGWSEKEEYKILENISDRGIIRLNRQFSPFTIIRLVGEDELLARLYSELC